MTYIQREFRGRGEVAFLKHDYFVAGLSQDGGRCCTTRARPNNHHITLDCQLACT